MSRRQSVRCFATTKDGYNPHKSFSRPHKRRLIKNYVLRKEILVFAFRNMLERRKGRNVIKLIKTYALQKVVLIRPFRRWEQQYASISIKYVLQKILSDDKYLSFHSI